MPKRNGKSLRGRSAKRFRRAMPTRVQRPLRAISNNTHNYKRMLGGNFANWSTGATIGTSAQIAGNAVHAPWLGNFNLGGIGAVVNSTDFTSLYDQYRVNYLELKFYLKIDPAAQTAASATITRLYWYRDFDDSGAPADLNEMRENGKTKVYVLDPYKPLTIRVKPNVVAAMYQSAVTTQYSPKFNTWLDCAQPTTPHYVGKFAIEDLRNTNLFVQVEGTLHFSCRQPR